MLKKFAKGDLNDKSIRLEVFKKFILKKYSFECAAKVINGNFKRKAYFFKSF